MTRALQPLRRRGKPDFQRFLKVLRRQGGRDYVPFFELCMDTRVFEPLSGLTPPVPLNFVPTAPTYEATFQYFLRWSAAVGFDHATINPSGFRGFPGARHGTAADVRRAFVQAGSGAVRDEADAERYPWPSAADIDVESMARVARLAPEGLGVMTGGAEPFSVLTDQVLGVETLSLMLYENPALVRHLADRVGQIVLDTIELTTALPFIDGYVLGGDLGYKTGTVVSPAVLRELIFPWYRRFVQAAHRHGKIILLHSCGNLAQVMDDLVACGFDGKHSFEDAITPGILELHARYGQRLALLGGVDVDFLCRASEEQIRQRVRDYIDRMAPAGGYILGSGNSIPEYCPVESFWIMLDEGLKYGR